MGGFDQAGAADVAGVMQAVTSSRRQTDTPSCLIMAPRRLFLRAEEVSGRRQEVGGGEGWGGADVRQQQRDGDTY